MTVERIGVLFVCHANVCRSPLCEGIFSTWVQRRGLGHRFVIDSAGCWATDGLDPHESSIAVAARHGIDLPATVGRSRSVVPDDLHRFDHIFAMDRANLADLERFRRLSAFGPVQPGKAQIRLLRHEVDSRARGSDAEIPDPIRFGPAAFEATFKLLNEACLALLERLTA